MDDYPFRTRRASADGFSRNVFRIGTGLGVLGLISLAGQSASDTSTELPAWVPLLQPMGWLALGMACALFVVAWADRQRRQASTRMPDPARAAPPRPPAAPSSSKGPSADEPFLTTHLAPQSGFEPSQFPHTVILSRRPADASNAARPDGRPAVPTDDWTPELLRVIDWRRFEVVCTRLFSHAGLDVQPRTVPGRRGVDIWLYSRHKPGEPVSVVHCCQWIEAEDVPEVLTAIERQMKSRSLTRATLATATALGAPMRQRAEVAGIAVLDAPGLFGLIRQRTAEQQEQLLALAIDGEYWRPTCHQCGIKMAERTDSTSGRALWACTNAPRCRHLLPRRDA